MTALDLAKKFRGAPEPNIYRILEEAIINFPKSANISPASESKHFNDFLLPKTADFVLPMIEHLKHLERVDDIKKPIYDKRNYRYIKLKNNMKCMLIEDCDSKKAAACMFVASGNLNDPPEANGLAHFCEHMLFLGSQKYPEEDSYYNYL